MDFAQKLDIIGSNIKKSQKVNSNDEMEHDEAHTLAHGLLDMEESFNAIIKLMPKLFSNTISEEEVDETLFDIGEELRHILYHINDSKFYDYLKVNGT